MTDTNPIEADIPGVEERLAAAINLGTEMGARGNHPSNIYNIADEALTAIRALSSRLQEAEKALGGCRCPRPCNHRPDEFTIRECVDAGECGCSDGAALANKGESDAG